MMLSDHVVLQRGASVLVWEWSSPQAHLTARFHQQTVEERADERAKSSLYLAPEQAGGPYKLPVSSDGLDNIIVANTHAASLPLLRIRAAIPRGSVFVTRGC